MLALQSLKLPGHMSARPRLPDHSITLGILPQRSAHGVPPEHAHDDAHGSDEPKVQHAENDPGIDPAHHMANLHPNLKDRRENRRGRQSQQNERNAWENGPETKGLTMPNHGPNADQAEYAAHHQPEIP